MGVTGRGRERGRRGEGGWEGEEWIGAGGVGVSGMEEGRERGQQERGGGWDRGQGSGVSFVNMNFVNSLVVCKLRFPLNSNGLYRYIGDF